MIIFGIEASGLGYESYPIEIAWQDSNNLKNFDSFLIKPAENWCYWDEYAEKAIHHISRAMLLSDGINTHEACDRLNNRLSGKTVYSDALVHDE